MSETFVRFGPVGLTVFLILWTIIVSPYSKYGDNWAIYPALPILPIVVIWHLVLFFIEKEKKVVILYGFIHISILIVIWLYCLMKISKDSL